jgi:mannitol/fructose-specific phosphotransferase system IIA component (Ntr-type)
MAVGTAPPGYDLSLCIHDLRSKKKDAALAEMASAAVEAGIASEGSLLLESLRMRERLGGTATGKGVALPHARSVTVSHGRILVARAPRGIDWSAVDQAPVQLVLMILAPAEWSDEAFHALMARAGATARLQRTRQKLLAAPSVEGLASAWREAMS